MTKESSTHNLHHTLQIGTFQNGTLQNGIYLIEKLKKPNILKSFTRTALLHTPQIATFQNGTLQNGIYLK